MCFLLSLEFPRVVFWAHFYFLSILTIYHNIPRDSLPFLFAENTKLVKPVLTSNDQSDLQEDILSISEWYKTWNLNLNKDKCAVICFFLLAKSVSKFSYTLLNPPVKFVQTHCDLGIMVDERLSWLKHYNYISQKAYHSLHFYLELLAQLHLLVSRGICTEHC